jgi:hypothetical protein
MNHLESGTSFGFAIKSSFRQTVQSKFVDVKKFHIICYTQIHWILKNLLKLDMKYAWFQASAANSMRTALLWVITQRIVVISCRRYGIKYRSHLYTTGRCDWSTRKDWCCLVINNAFYKLYLINSLSLSQLMEMSK